jgi:hypothetical protein
MGSCIKDMSMDILKRDNKRLRTTNKRLRDELAETQELLAFSEAEKNHAMQTLDEERAEKEKAQAELAQLKARVQAEKDHCMSHARTEVNRIRTELQAEMQGHLANAKVVLGRNKEKLMNEHSRAETAELMLKTAQKERRNHLLVKAAYNTAKRKYDDLVTHWTDPFFAT